MKSLLGTVSQLWRKAEREAYRSFHARTRVHKADHFLNFCITAHSLRDYFLEDRAIQGTAARTAFHVLWGKEPLIVAVSEIANLSKHFRLRMSGSGDIKAAKTRRVSQGSGVSLDVYVTSTGAITNIPRRVHELTIVTEDGARHDLWEFQIDVLDYWNKFLRQHGIRVRRQRGNQFLAT